MLRNRLHYVSPAYLRQELSPAARGTDAYGRPCREDREVQEPQRDFVWSYQEVSQTPWLIKQIAVDSELEKMYKESTIFLIISSNIKAFIL